MIELHVSWWQALLERLYWRPGVQVPGEPEGVYESQPRVLAWLIRPLLHFEEPGNG